MSISEKKAAIGVQEIDYLGLELRNGEHKMQEHVLKKIEVFPSKIEDNTQLQRFLGILTYCESYIPDLSAIRKPLQEKLKKGVQWSWTQTDEMYVKYIKEKVTSLNLTLYQPLPEDIMILETDASDDAWGAVLKARCGKEGQSVERVCRYASGMFTATETRYPAHEREYLAVKKGIKKFYLYLVEKEFIVRTDNKSFGPFLKKNIEEDRHSRLLRWQIYFSGFQFKVEYVPGEKNSLPHSLTREFKNV